MAHAADVTGSCGDTEMEDRRSAAAGEVVGGDDRAGAADVVGCKGGEEEVAVGTGGVGRTSGAGVAGGANGQAEEGGGGDGEDWGGGKKGKVKRAKDAVLIDEDGDSELEERHPKMKLETFRDDAGVNGDGEPEVVAKSELEETVGLDSTVKATAQRKRGWPKGSGKKGRPKKMKSGSTPSGVKHEPSGEEMGGEEEGSAKQAGSVWKRGWPKGKPRRRNNDGGEGGGRVPGPVKADVDENSKDDEASDNEKGTASLGLRIRRNRPMYYLDAMYRALDKDDRERRKNKLRGLKTREKGHSNEVGGPSQGKKQKLHDESIGSSHNLHRREEKSRKTVHDSLCCHQCQKANKGRVVRCLNCQSKRYCIPCLRWYPFLSEEDVALKCPFCRGNCNCKQCLRLKKVRQIPEKELDVSCKLEHSRHLLHYVLPVLEELCRKQRAELEIEACIQCLENADLKLEMGVCSKDECMCCNFCRTSIFDFHRSCPNCSLELCLACCQELREGHLVTSQTMTKLRSMNQGSGSLNKESLKMDSTSDSIDWKAEADGSISCPPTSLGGCGTLKLKLKTLHGTNTLFELLQAARNMVQSNEFQKPCELFSPCSCYDQSDSLRKAACRIDSNDNYLYCPTADDNNKDVFLHFQKHWLKGEPVIVRNVLDLASGLSWEPMVLARAIRERKMSRAGFAENNVVAIDCETWTEVEVSINSFFKGYINWMKVSGEPMLKLQNWPSSDLFEDRLARHGFEFIGALPFQEYTHPKSGTCNLAAKLRKGSLQPELGPKLHIAYGCPYELGSGNSVTKLHYDMSDVVNILTHTTEVWNSKCLDKDTGKAREDFGNSYIEKNDRPINAVVDHADGGALWDIFRREDSAKLQEYLRSYSREFKRSRSNKVNENGVEKVFHHLIFDQTFYLTEEHKRKLKEEFGIEPWSFVQNRGEAVLIPVGCAYQIRNLKSCTNVTLGFISPENVCECLRLNNECCMLPTNHFAKMNGLEVYDFYKFQIQVMKMLVYGVKQALNRLGCATTDSNKRREKKVHLKRLTDRSSMILDSQPSQHAEVPSSYVFQPELASYNHKPIQHLKGLYDRNVHSQPSQHADAPPYSTSQPELACGDHIFVEPLDVHDECDGIVNILSTHNAVVSSYLAPQSGLDGKHNDPSKFVQALKEDDEVEMVDPQVIAFSEAGVNSTDLSDLPVSESACSHFISLKPKVGPGHCDDTVRALPTQYGRVPSYHAPESDSADKNHAPFKPLEVCDGDETVENQVAIEFAAQSECINLIGLSKSPTPELSWGSRVSLKPLEGHDVCGVILDMLPTQHEPAQRYHTHSSLASKSYTPFKADEIDLINLSKLPIPEFDCGNQTFLKPLDGPGDLDKILNTLPTQNVNSQEPICHSPQSGIANKSHTCFEPLLGYAEVETVKSQANMFAAQADVVDSTDLSESLVSNVVHSRYASKTIMNMLSDLDKLTLNVVHKSYDIGMPQDYIPSPSINKFMVGIANSSMRDFSYILSREVSVEHALEHARFLTRSLSGLGLPLSAWETAAQSILRLVEQLQSLRSQLYTDCMTALREEFRRLNKIAKEALEGTTETCHATESKMTEAMSVCSKMDEQSVRLKSAIDVFSLKLKEVELERHTCKKKLKAKLSSLLLELSFLYSTGENPMMCRQHSFL